MAQDMVDKEIRRMIIDRAAQANRTASALSSFTSSIEDNDLFRMSPKKTTQRRRLNTNTNDNGDWDALNEILDSFELTIPNTVIEQDLLGFTLFIQANGTCRQPRVGDIRLDYDKGDAVSRLDKTSLAYKFQILNASLRCFLTVSWNTGVLDVQDDLKIKLLVNETSIGVAVNLVGAPPETSEFLGCKVAVNVGDLQSSGGFSSDIINDLNSLVVDLVRNEAGLISGVVCDALANLTETIDGLLISAGDIVAPFLNSAYTDVDPLLLENNLPPGTPPLVSYRDSEGLGNVIGVLLSNLVGIINADQINTVVGSTLLDEDGVFTLVLEEELPWEQEEVMMRFLQDGTVAPDEGGFIPAECNPLGRRNRRLTNMFEDYVNTQVDSSTNMQRRSQSQSDRRLQLQLFENITLDDFINTTDILVINDITPMNISLLGLNNFSDGAPLTVIGDYTFLSVLNLAEIYVEAVIAVDVAINNVTVQEVITLSVDVTEIFVNASLLVGLSEEVVDTWTIGTFLDTTNLIPCLLSALKIAGVSQLRVTAGAIGTPVVTGSLSDGVNELLNTGLEGAACAYQDLILEAIPGFFQQNVTQLINEFLDCFIEVEASTSVCPESPLLDGLLDTETGNDDDVEFDFKQQGPANRNNGNTRQESDGFVQGYLDFRDLLLLPQEAKDLGGKGSEPYGDLISLAFGTFMSTLTDVDALTGLPGVNGLIPQDGLDFDIELLNTTIDTSNTSIINTLLDTIKLAAYNLRAQNLNTLVTPLMFLEPTTNAHVLSNLFNFGPVPGQELNTTVTVMMEVDGPDSPLAVSKEMDAAARMQEVELLADFRVMISTVNFIQFPLRDLLALNCWFALVEEPATTTADGETIKNSFEVMSMVLDIVKMQFNFKCLNCSGEVLPEAIEVLDDAGAMEVLGDRLGPLIEEFSLSEVFPPLVTGLIGIGEQAARKCPHHTLFNTTSNETDSSAPFEIPPLSEKSVDTVMYTAILAAEVFGVVFAESHIINAVPLSDPLSGEESFNRTDKANLLDWFRLNETFIPLAADALGFVRDFLGATEDGEVGVNGLVTDFLEEDGSFNLSLGIALDLIDGYEIAVDSLQVYGLDSFKAFDILEPFAPQTLRNSIEMDNLTIYADFSINVTNTSDPAQAYRVSFDVHDVNATIYLFTAIDMDKIESLEVGSLLFIANILSCMLDSANDLHVPAMRVAIGNMSDPVVEGLMPDTNEAAAKSIAAVSDKFGSLFMNATNAIFDNSIRRLVNEFLTDFVATSPECLSPDALVPSNMTDSPFIDFRDLLLSPEDSLALGGSGLQPYGDVASTVYALLRDQLAANGTGEYLSLNSFIDDLSEGQSGVKGTVRLQDELFGFVLEDQLSVEFLDSLNLRVEFNASDGRFENLNTLTSPLAVARPTSDPYVLENMINLGPNASNPLMATLGVLLGIEGELKSLNMFNQFDLQGTLSEIDLFAAISVYLRKEKLFRFPLRDILEVDCWLSLFPTPNATTNTSAFEIESLLTKLASLSTGVDCLNCTSRVLSEAVQVFDKAGASETLGERLGFLIEDISTSESIPLLLQGFLDFGDDAGRSCPHHPLFNTSAISLQAANDTLTLPPLSSLSIDTILFAAVMFAEVSVIVGADNHLQNPGETTGPFSLQDSIELPEEAKLIDWTNLDDVGIPFMGEVLGLVRGLLGDTTETETGGEDIGVNGLVQGLLDESGTFILQLEGISFELSGVELKINAVQARGLDTFSEFDVLNPIGAQTMQNNIGLDKLTLALDISVDVLETDEYPNNLTVTFEMENLNFSIPIFAAVDENKLGNLTIGSLLHLSNLLPCVLSTTYGIQLEQMLVTIGNISDPSFEGLLPDTTAAADKATTALFDRFGDMVMESIPLVFEDTLRVLLNSYLGSFVEYDCKQYDTNTTARYVDFREVFRPTNATGYSPYGDIIPLLKELLDENLFEDNPETEMPKLNDVLIAPFTLDQSGVEGQFLIPGKIFGVDTEALADFGLGLAGLEIFDARVENLDTVGQPLMVLAPNETRGDLFDNMATLGTQVDPLRFALRVSLSFMGPLLQTRDEMDIFGELRSAPIFSVLMARIGAQEVLNLPLKYTSNVDCWLAALAEPALDMIEAGNTTVNPILSLDYLNIAFQSMRISASCFNCTTRGLEVVPELLEILETTTTKNVLGYRNVELMLDLINSDFAQVWLLRIFQDSIRKCEYTENATSTLTEFENPPFPDLTDYNMETGVFTVTVLLQLGLVILAETINDLDGADPIFSDPVPDIPPGTRLVDWTALDEYANGGLILGAIDVMNSFLGEQAEDPETGETTIGINDILGNPLVPFEDVAFDNQLDFGIAGLNIAIKGVTIAGLDTFTRFKIANIVGPTMLQHEVGWERLQLDFKLEIDLAGSDEDSEFRRALENVEGDGKFPFSLTIELQDVAVDASTFLALDYELLKYVELGSFLRLSSLLPCIQATILHLEVTDMLLQIGRVTKMQVSGWESEDTRVAAENLEETLLEKFGETIASMAPNAFSGALRPLMNTLINNYLRESDFKCDEFPFDPATGGFIDFRDLLKDPAGSLALGGTGMGQYGDLFSTVFDVSKLLIRFILLPEFDEIEIPGPILDQGIIFAVRKFQSAIALRISDLKINNLASIGALAYIEPVDGEAHLVNNSVALGVGRGKPIGIKFKVYYAFKGLGGQLEEVDIANEFEVSLDIKSLELIAEIFFLVSEQKFVEFPLRNMLNINCWLATVPPPEIDESGRRKEGSNDTLSVDNIIIAMKELNMGINCLNCSSPGLFELNELLQVPVVSDELTNVTNRVAQGLADKFSGSFLQDQLDRLLVDAPKHCPHTDNYDPNAPAFVFSTVEAPVASSTPYLNYLLAVCIPLLFALIIILVVRSIVHKRHKKWLAALPSEKVFLIQQKQEKQDHAESELNELTLSMFESPEVPRFARYIVPFIVLLNIGFFLSGHLSLAGRAQIDFTIAGETFRVDNFYEFSIAQSTLDLWHSGGEALAALILVFSGIWPYTKQLITLSLWFLPPSVVSVSRRGQFLVWLDILAKWSMIDIFVLLITLAGFRITGASPDFAFLPTNFYEVQLVIVPMWGLYANTIAQLMSQISSHFIVMYHRRIIRKGKQTYKERHHPQSKTNVVTGEADAAEVFSSELPEDVKKEQLCKHPFIRAHKEDEDKVVARRSANFLLPFSSVLLAVLLVFCCVLPSLRLEAYGIVGIAIEVGDRLKTEAVRYESIFSMAWILVEQSVYLGELKHYIGNVFLAFLFVVTLLVVPIMMLVTFMYMWLFPQTRERREKIAVTIETLQAWQYAEVYILGIVIESWQLGSVSKLFLNRYCEILDPILKNFASYGILDPKDAQCFALEASITSGAYLLIPFVFGLAIIGTFVLKAYVQYLREKHDLDDDISEEEKLRAFDRTTWDNRENALENIRNPPVLFTDTFRWTLCRGIPTDSSTVASQPEALLDASCQLDESCRIDESSKLDEAPMVADVTTYPADTSSSDSENADKVPSDEEA